MRPSFSTNMGTGSLNIPKGTHHIVRNGWLYHIVGENSFFRRGGGWARGIQGRVINFLPAQKGKVSINLTQQRGGSLKCYCFLGQAHFFKQKIEREGCEILHSCS